MAKSGIFKIIKKLNSRWFLFSLLITGIIIFVYYSFFPIIEGNAMKPMNIDEQNMKIDEQNLNDIYSQDDDIDNNYIICLFDVVGNIEKGSTIKFTQLDPSYYDHTGYTSIAVANENGTPKIFSGIVDKILYRILKDDDNDPVKVVSILDENVTNITKNGCSADITFKEKGKSKSGRIDNIIYVTKEDNTNKEYYVNMNRLTSDFLMEKLYNRNNLKQ